MKNFLAILKKYTLAMVMNFTGLVLAFTAFMALMLQVGYQQSFDKMHPTSGRIYRVDKVGIGNDDVFRNILPRGYVDDIIGSSPHIQTATISCPFIEEGVFYAQRGNNLEPFAFKSAWDVCYPGIFEIFGTEIIEGSAKNLESYSNIAIPASLAKRLYGDDSAYGKVITNDRMFGFSDANAREMVVGVVYRDFPANSQMRNCIYRHIGTMQQGNYGGANFACWILLDSPENKTLVEDNFNSNFDYGENKDWLTDIELTPIEDIYFEDEGSAIYRNGSRGQMWLLICISALVMLIGGINYSTFFTALAPIRVKTINTQKVLGSSQFQLRRGLIMEAVVFCLSAFAISLCIIAPVTEWLYSQGLSESYFTFAGQLPLVLLSAGFAVCTGLAAGIYPSLYVTSLPPAFALKGNFAFSLSGRRFRTIMMVLQYVISFALLVFVAQVYRQNKFMMEHDLGFDREQVLVTRISQKHYLEKEDWLRERLCSLPEVEDVAYASDLVGGEDVYGVTTLNLRGEDVRTFTLYCSYNFLDVLGIPVVDGRNFLESDTHGSQHYAIMNQKVKDLGGAIEETIIGQSGPVRVNSMRNESAPLLYIVLPDGYAALDYTYIRLHSGFSKTEALEKVYSVLKEMDSEYLFEVKHYDEILGILYEPEVKQGKIISLFTLLAAALSLIGVFGQVLLDVQYRKRDIAVRKVYGAEISGLVVGGLRKYFTLVMVSFIIAVPVAWYAVTQWQQNFAERTGVSALLFIGAFIAIQAITIAIVAFQYWRAATLDPADTLHKE